MDRTLLRQALIKGASGMALMGVLLFLPAGTFDFWQAWLLLGLLLVPMVAAGALLLRRDPERLRRRLDTREHERDQRLLIALSGTMFVAAFVIAGLTRRCGWMMLPSWASWAAAVVFLAGYALYGETLRENAYLSRTVGVQEGQRLIDSGLYGIVRHPMYTATLLLFLSMPLVLGSPQSFCVMLLYLPIIVRRIAGEERVLEEGLPGYAAYRQRVRYRLLPHVW